MKKRIYLDHAATTPVRSEVTKAMQEYFASNFGNPSGLYLEARDAKLILDRSRKDVARLIGARKPSEVIFVGGGTESCNLAIKGIARANKIKDSHLLVSKIEHYAVLCPTRYLREKEGFKTTYIKPDREGIVQPEDIKKLITDKTILISIMYANNEIGTINPISEIAKIIKKIKAQRSKAGNNTPLYFHTDACQAAGYLDINVGHLGVDLMTLNGSKIYGPKGVGILYIKEGTLIQPVIQGGGQEKDIRSGTENIPSIVGFAKALSLTQSERNKESQRLIKLRNYFINELLKFPKTCLNGHAKKRLPNNVNISVLDIEGESILLYLDEKGVAISTGSACHAHDLEPSHVIRGIGRSQDAAHGSLRFTMGKSTTKKDLDYVLKVLPNIISKLRTMSPIKLSEKECEKND
ncbi:cysteine desulfurase family protein [Patescibacteria group bacterium]